MVDRRHSFATHPPHPALRAARQLHPQGQHRPRSPTPGRIAAWGTCRTGGTVRSAPAMSLLRRPDAYHRDLRALEPTTCAAASVHTNRDGVVVTRHGLSPCYAVARSLRPETRRAPVVHDRAISDQPAANEASARPIGPNTPRSSSNQDPSKAPLNGTPAHA